MSGAKGEPREIEEIVRLIDGAGSEVPTPHSVEELRKELARLSEENELLKAQGRNALRLQVSQKGALSVYGLGRFPVTLYKRQWLRLLDVSNEIRRFIESNSSALAEKTKE